MIKWGLRKQRNNIRTVVYENKYTVIANAWNISTQKSITEIHTEVTFFIKNFLFKNWDPGYWGVNKGFTYKCEYHFKINLMFFESSENAGILVGIIKYMCAHIPCFLKKNCSRLKYNENCPLGRWSS